MSKSERSRQIKRDRTVTRAIIDPDRSMLHASSLASARNRATMTGDDRGLRRQSSFRNQLFLMSHCTLPSAAIKLNSPHCSRRVAPFFPSRVIIKVNRITGNSPLDAFSAWKASQSVHRDTPDWTLGRRFRKAELLGSAPLWISGKERENIGEVGGSSGYRFAILP